MCGSYKQKLLASLESTMNHTAPATVFHIKKITPNHTTRNFFSFSNFWRVSCNWHPQTHPWKWKFDTIITNNRAFYIHRCYSCNFFHTNSWRSRASIFGTDFCNILKSEVSNMSGRQKLTIIWNFISQKCPGKFENDIFKKQNSENFTEGPKQKVCRLTVKWAIVAEMLKMRPHTRKL